MDVVKFNRPRVIGDLIAVEFDQNYCRERVTLAAGTGASRVVPQFAVVGLITATNKYVQFAAGASDGSQNAAGVSLNGCTAPNGEDNDMDILKRGPVIVRREELVWPDGATDAQRTAAMMQLTALGILCKVSG